MGGFNLSFKGGKASDRGKDQEGVVNPKDCLHCFHWMKRADCNYPNEFNFEENVNPFVHREGQNKQRNCCKCLMVDEVANYRPTRQQ